MAPTLSGTINRQLPYDSRKNQASVKAAVVLRERFIAYENSHIFIYRSGVAAHPGFSCSGQTQTSV
jgi:hypothetical protein